MTAKSAIINGSYCDLRFVKTRKVAQVTVEIPIEQAARFVEMFGAPDPSKECPVALARLDPGKIAPVAQTEPSEAPKDKRKWSEMPPAQQAAIRCMEPGFWKYCDCRNADEAAEHVRSYCGVASRSDLNRNPQSAARWRQLDDDYIIHTRGYAEMVR